MMRCFSFDQNGQLTSRASFKSQSQRLLEKLRTYSLVWIYLSANNSTKKHRSVGFYSEVSGVSRVRTKRGKKITKHNNVPPKTINKTSQTNNSRNMSNSIKIMINIQQTTVICTESKKLEIRHYNTTFK